MIIVVKKNKDQLNSLTISISLCEGKAGFCLLALTKKTTKSIVTKLFKNHCGDERKGFSKVFALKKRTFPLHIKKNHLQI